jgi:23S rRNA G2069 N7-methylase RlmK/C1962 C5-methylase RlmI
LDPPTFSRNKGFSFSVQKDHPALIADAFEILNPDGFILFSNNYKEFEMSEEVLGKYKAEEKTDSIPPDFEGSWPHVCYVIRRLS